MSPVVYPFTKGIDTFFYNTKELNYRANNIKKAIIKQNSPIASDIANPKIAYVNNCCFREGFLAYTIIKLPNTVPIPAPLPAAPIEAAQAPTNFAAVNISVAIFPVVFLNFHNNPKSCLFVLSLVGHVFFACFKSLSLSVRSECSTQSTRCFWRSLPGIDITASSKGQRFLSEIPLLLSTRIGSRKALIKA